MSRPDFDRFVAESTDGLLRTAYLIAWDLHEAEDLVQETLFRVARRWPKVSRMDHPVAYARRILVNLALEGNSKRSRRPELSDQPLPTQPSPPPRWPPMMDPRLPPPSRTAGWSPGGQARPTSLQRS